MKKKCQEDSSSSEDEASIQALREAADQNFLKSSLFNNEKETKAIIQDSKTNDLTKKNDTEEEYLNYGISQSCKDFIAKKLNERLATDILLEEKKILKNKNNAQDDTGIKLFSSSNFVLSKMDESLKPQRQKKKKRKNHDPTYDEKTNFSKCEEVAISSESILSQWDIKHWSNRKPGKEYKYKKLKDGKIIEMKN